MEDKALLSTEEASGAEKAELLIVIPAYNEAENIERVVNHLTANFPQYDYVVVNDGSRDETAAICQRNGYNLLNLRSIWDWRGHFRRDLNMPTSTDINMRVQLDGDGQHRPEYLEAMMKKMKKVTISSSVPGLLGEKAIYDADAWK